MFDDFTFARMETMHRVLLFASLVATAGAVAGRMVSGEAGSPTRQGCKKRHNPATL